MPVICDFGIGDGLQEPFAKAGIQEKPAHVGKRPAMAAFEKGKNGIAQHRMHLIPPTARQPFED